MESARSRVTKLMLVWMAVTAVILSTTACAKKSSGGAKTAPVQVPPVPNPQPVAVPDSEIDDMSGRSSQENVGNVGDGGGAATDGGAGGDNEAAENTTATKESETGVPEAKAPRSSNKSVVHYDPTGMTSDEIFLASSKQGAPLTGVASDVRDLSGAALVFSPSGQDTLQEEIIDMVSQDKTSSKEQAAADKKLAALLSDATFNIDWSTRRAEVSFILKKGKKRLLIRSENQLDNSLAFSAGSLNVPPHIAFDVACMDLNGGCRTVHIKVQQGDGDKVKTAHMIARQTGASLFIEGNGYGMAKNPEYDRFLNILLNTVNHPNSLNSVTKLTLSTSETVGGQSSFSISMRITLADRLAPRGRDEYLVWSGPLVKRPGTDQLDLVIKQAPAAVGRQANMVSDLISDTIRETRLVRNDGRGNLKLAVTVRKATAMASEETVLLTIARIHKPVRPLIFR